MSRAWLLTVTGFSLFLSMDFITVALTRYAIGTTRYIEANPVSGILFQSIGYVFTAALGIALVVGLFLFVRTYMDSYFGNRLSSFSFLFFVILVKMQDLGMDLHTVYGTWWF